MLRGAVAVFLIAVSLLISSPQVFGADTVSLRFDNTAYRVEGSTLLTNNQIQSAVTLSRGKQREIADFQRALRALTSATPIPPRRVSPMTRLAS